jgi:2',3'-cyclic-nucleotide 2'-phosphodiesterase (5'-nucleotidase family)
METARTMIDGYNAIGYQAYNVSSKDFAAERVFIKDIQQTAKFPFISANILDSLTRQPIFKPYIIKKVGSKKFGIVGITSAPSKPIFGIEVLPPFDALKDILPKIRKKADYIILLGNLERKDETKLLTGPVDVDFVLLSGGYRYSRDLETRDKMLVARCGNIGKYVGIIKFDLQNTKEKLSDISRANLQIAYAQKRLDSFTSAANGQPVEKYYSSNPTVLSTIKSLKDQIEKLSKENEQVTNPVTYELIGLDETIPDDPVLRAKLNELWQIIDNNQNDR